MALSRGASRLKDPRLRGLFYQTAFVVVICGLAVGAARVVLVKPDRPEKTTVALMAAVRPPERDEG